jgi:hypothetical protein
MPAARKRCRGLRWPAYENLQDRTFPSRWWAKRAPHRLPRERFSALAHRGHGSMSALRPVSRLLRTSGVDSPRMAGPAVSSPSHARGRRRFNPPTRHLYPASAPTPDPTPPRASRAGGGEPRGRAAAPIRRRDKDLPRCGWGRVGRVAVEDLRRLLLGRPLDRLQAGPDPGELRRRIRSRRRRRQGNWLHGAGLGRKSAVINNNSGRGLF